MNRVFFRADLHISLDPREINCEIRLLKKFCESHKTTKADVVVMLGDTAVNSNAYVRDQMVKKALEELPITIAVLYGNHEVRVEDVPPELAQYEMKEWRGGKVFVESKYPSLIFLIDGEVYDLNGKQAIAIGGAHSIDCKIRKNSGRLWRANEQPSEEIKKRVKAQLANREWKIDLVLSHTVPEEHIPKEALLPKHPSYVFDNSTEEWLQEIENDLEYESWYCGHFHIDKDDGKFHFVFGRFLELP